MKTNTIAQSESVASSGDAANRSKEKELKQRYQQAAPGSTAENELVQKHLPLVKTIVGRIAMTLPTHVSMDDLYSAGLVGLLNAIRNFDSKSNTAFETYARLRIRGAVFDELRRLDWVPRSVHAKAKKVQIVMHELEQKHGRVPTELEMARSMDLSLDEYQQLLDEIRPASFVCLDSAMDAENEDGPTRYENVADQRQEDPVESATRREMTKLIAERLEQLPEMQRKVLALYYFEGLRLREIAEAYNLTESRICQIHAQAIVSIRSFLKKFDTDTEQ
jgi:RNA polymerase sigma factor for flagellar operon FliA